MAADAQDWIIQGGTSRRGRRPPDWSIEGPEAEDALDWMVRGKTARSGYNPRTGSTGEERRDAEGRIVRVGRNSTGPDSQDRSGRSTKEDAKEEQSQ